MLAARDGGGGLELGPDKQLGRSVLPNSFLELIATLVSVSLHYRAREKARMRRCIQRGFLHFLTRTTTFFSVLPVHILPLRIKFTP